MSSTMIFRRVAGVLLVAVLWCAAIARASFAGIDPEANTDGFNPAADLYDIAETQRQGQVALQHELVDWMVRSICYVPGDLWRPPLGGPPIRQPIGHESKQVAPNRWIYRPLYAQDVQPGSATGPANGIAPQPAPAELPAPSDAKPDDFVPPQAAPKPPAPRGRREF